MTVPLINTSLKATNLFMTWQEGILRKPKELLSSEGIILLERIILLEGVILLKDPPVRKHCKI